MGRKALRVAIGMGVDADLEILSEFIDTPGLDLFWSASWTSS